MTVRLFAAVLFFLAATHSLALSACQLEFFNIAPYKITLRTMEKKPQRIITSDPIHRGFQMLRKDMCIRGLYVEAWLQYGGKLREYISKTPVNTVNNLVLLQFPKDFRPK